ncbi:MAG: MAPEG family protein [Kofleriaceae bacterium]
MPPVITALYGALNALFNIFLANNVSTKRRVSKVGLGEGSDPAMLVAIRAHGNNAEFVPLAIIVMLLLEMCGADRAVLHVYGGLLFAARVSHWIGLPRKAPNPFRFGGTAITWTLIVAGAVYLLYLRFRITGAI